MNQLMLEFNTESTSVIRTSSSAISMVGHIGIEYVKATYEIIKNKIKSNRVIKYVVTQLAKLDRFVTHPTVVKLATTFVGLETIAGFFTCIGTSTLLFASGNALLGAGVIVVYILTTIVRYIVTRNAILETHNVKEAS